MLVLKVLDCGLGVDDIDKRNDEATVVPGSNGCNVVNVKNGERDGCANNGYEAAAQVLAALEDVDNDNNAT